MASWLQKISPGNESRARKEKMMNWVFQTLAIRSRLKKGEMGIPNSRDKIAIEKGRYVLVKGATRVVL